MSHQSDEYYLGHDNFKKMSRRKKERKIHTNIHIHVHSELKMENIVQKLIHSSLKVVACVLMQHFVEEIASLKY